MLFALAGPSLSVKHGISLPEGKPSPDLLSTKLTDTNLLGIFEEESLTKNPEFDAFITPSLSESES
jgi:hypothetical protein